MGCKGTLSSAIRYGHPVGRVRVLEGRLLTNATLERLLDAPSFLEQRRVLADSPYGSWLEDAQDADGVEAALDGTLEEIYEFVETAHLPHEVSRYFRVHFDYANLKGRLKAEALGIPVDDLLVPHGEVPVELFSGPVDNLPEAFRALEAAVRGSDGAVDRMLVDSLVDNAMHEELLALATAAGCPMLVSVARLTLDLANVRVVLRARRLEWPMATAWTALASGGSASPQTLMASYGLKLDALAARMAELSFLGGVDPDELESIEHLDIVADNLLMRQAKKARLVATGIEPVIGYVLARQSEIVIIRMLLLGKMAGLSADALRKRTRDLYV